MAHLCFANNSDVDAACSDKRYLSKCVSVSQVAGTDGTQLSVALGLQLVK